MNSEHFLVVSSSVPGVRHRQHGIGCHDKYESKELLNGLLIIAMADGAGSAKEAETGAQLAVQVAVEGLARNLAQPQLRPGHDLLRSALHEAWMAVQKQASQLAVSASDLASTMLLVTATPTEIWSLQIGDGAIVVRGKDRVLHRLGQAQRGEFANETSFLVSPDAILNASAAHFAGAWSELAVLTDGLEVISTSPGASEPHGPFFHPVFDFVASANDLRQAEADLHEFLTTPPVSELADDDLALVLARPIESGHD